MIELEQQNTEFSTITANIDEDTAEKLCCRYVEQSMHPATISLFNELMSNGEEVQYALYRAVINQSVVTAMLEDLNKPGRPIPPFNI